MYEELNQFQKPLRVHPAGIIFSLISFLKDSVLGLGVGAFAFLRQSPKYAIMFIIGVAFLLILFSILSWFRHVFWVENGELREESGIFIRKKRYISINRIHRIDLTANVIHRIFNLTRVNVDTASGNGQAEVSLSALKIKDAEKLRSALKREKADNLEENPEIAIEEQEVTLTKKISWKHLFIAGTTSGRAGVIIAIVFLGFSQVQQFIPEHAYESAFNWVIQLSLVFIIISVIVILILLYLFGIAGTMIKFGNFVIEKRPEELFIKRGLLETKELTIPYDRIQAIEIEQNLLREPIKFARISAIVAGGTGDTAYPVIFPLLPMSQVETFLQTFLPDYVQVNKTFTPLDKKGQKYYLFKHAILFVLALIPVLYFFPKFSWIPGIFILLGLGYGGLAFRHGGYILDGNRLVLRTRRMFTKVTIIAFKKRIQSLEKGQHKFQQIENLATTSIALMSLGPGYGSVRHLNVEDANKISDWYSRRGTDS